MFSSWNPASWIGGASWCIERIEAELVRQARELREEFAQVQARHLRPDRAERAADVARRVRLRVERVEVAGPPTMLMKMHDFAVPSRRAGACRCRGLARARPAGAGGGGAEEVAAVGVCVVTWCGPGGVAVSPHRNRRCGGCNHSSRLVASGAAFKRRIRLCGRGDDAGAVRLVEQPRTAARPRSP